MGVTVGANFRSVVHKRSSGVTICFPDVCKTPTPGGPIPIPYPNIGRSADTAKAAKKVKADGCPVSKSNSNIRMTCGDEPGVLGGIISGKIKGKCDWITSSFDVKVEGKGVVRAFDICLHNKKNTAPYPILQKPIVVIVMDEKPKCLICDKAF
ncbi:DUF4150 domain-containing protein [Acanthopleuribacter pedis]|uniref:DUF4150 domain-containing protein n=1 Tax=Acanthopleuribacter pedis TaxID=442870 RepID=A0A8J7Q0P6_9BACT|nr:DUF4150 domain-containing protein [Acanthopleuribacter pedis]MBO1317079.1 DUF4150 domain-containing protein [Acanthopleuribacter pedis]